MDYLLQIVVEDLANAGGSAELPKGELSDLYHWVVRDGLAIAEDILVRPIRTSDVREMARTISRATRGRYRARRWFDDFVNYTDVARRAGVTPEAVRLWAHGARAQGFPRPYQHVGIGRNRSPIWRWGDISQWLAATNRTGSEGAVFPNPEMIAIFNEVLCTEPPFAAGVTIPIGQPQSLVVGVRPRPRTVPPITMGARHG